MKPTTQIHAQVHSCEMQPTQSGGQWAQLIVKLEERKQQGDVKEHFYTLKMFGPRSPSLGQYASPGTWMVFRVNIEGKMYQGKAYTDLVVADWAFASPNTQAQAPPPQQPQSAPLNIYDPGPTANLDETPF